MADVADNADIEVERINAEALAQHKKRQALIEESMRPHVPGQPSDCDDCGQPIPEARLKALPFTGRCVDCATAFELHLRTMHG